MSSKRNYAYRLPYYEDDVVEYSNSGKYPRIPEKYKECKFYWNKHRHTLKAFYTMDHARIAMEHAKRHSYPSSSKNVIFCCPKCNMYHITSEYNYKKYIIGIKYI